MMRRQDDRSEIPTPTPSTRFPLPAFYPLTARGPGHGRRSVQKGFWIVQGLSPASHHTSIHSSMLRSSAALNGHGAKTALCTRCCERWTTRSSSSLYVRGKTQKYLFRSRYSSVLRPPRLLHVGVAEQWQRRTRHLRFRKRVAALCSRGAENGSPRALSSTLVSLALRCVGGWI